MKLEKEKNSTSGYYKIGYDRHSENYLRETDDTFGNHRYFIITQQQYMWFENDSDKLEALYDDCVKKSNRSNIFFFSNWEKENSEEQNRLMWEYNYRELLIGKHREEVHRIIGNPNESTMNQRIEKFYMSKNLRLQLVYEKDICQEVVC